MQRPSHPTFFGNDYQKENKNRKSRGKKEEQKRGKKLLGEKSEGQGEQSKTASLLGWDGMLNKEGLCVMDGGAV